MNSTRFVALLAFRTHGPFYLLRRPITRSKTEMHPGLFEPWIWACDNAHVSLAFLPYTPERALAVHTTFPAVYRLAFFKVTLLSLGPLLTGADMARADRWEARSPVPGARAAHS